MGEVYLAEDTRLSRKVALKFLPEGLAPDSDTRRRFATEARTVSSLNEPHIVTIYDIGSDGHRDFIAMEYVEGETLRDLLAAGRIEVRQALEIAAQAASGLAAAHEAGVIHRDVKPENLVINRASQVKILDFGLAKLAERGRASLLSSEATTTVASPSGAPAETVNGTILGTVSYMSPEQASGRPLDQRTDIYSLGLVLYELLTGNRAFSRNSAVETLHAIINEEPRPAREWNPRLPREAIDVLDKALAKDSADRYRHAGDMALDLRRVKRALESGAVPVAASAPARGKPRLPILIRVLVGALVLGAGLAGWWLSRSRAPSSAISPLADVSLTPLTTDPGYEGEPTFSPDGETIAYVSDRTGNFEIFLKQVSGGPDINITNNPADDVQPAFSPDGKQIAFASSRQSATALRYEGTDSPLMGGDIWVMPALGGSPRRIAESGNFPSWSRDGSEIFYSSGTWFRQKIYRVPASGGTPREVPIRFPPAQGPPSFLLYPRMSPDGRWIVFEGHGVSVVPAEGGDVTSLAQGMTPAWAADSGAIFYSSAEPGKNYSAWKIPFNTREGKAAGPPEPLTVGRGRDTQPAVSSSGAIAYCAMETSFNLEVLAFEAGSGRVTGTPRPITTGNGMAFFNTFSPDGRFVTFNWVGGSSSHIWKVEIGSTPVQLTSDPRYSDAYPRWSPDGLSIAFIRGGALWMMTADGANPRSVIEKTGLNGLFSWTPDGRGLVYASPSDKQLYLFDLATRQSRRLTDEPGLMSLSAVSPDGKWVVYQSTMSGNVDLRAVPAAGGPSRDVVATPHQDYHPVFSPSGDWLYFQLDHKNLWRVPGPTQGWRDAPPQKVTDFPESGLLLEDFQISRDGKQLVYSRGRITGDLWLWRRMKPSGRGDTR
jgi:eukaryotic-like serine/threonine-protein kinase